MKSLTAPSSVYRLDGLAHAPHNTLASLPVIDARAVVMVSGVAIVLLVRFSLPSSCMGGSFVEVEEGVEGGVVVGSREVVRGTSPLARNAAPESAR